MGSSSNYNVNLRFTADANAAKAEIKSLQAELNKIATGKLLPKDNLSTLTPEIQKAMAAAGELQAKLESAVNVNTGKLDLGKFSDSLKSSGKTLTQYAQQLNALGPEGQQAFTQLAQAVIKAETPIIRCSDHLKKLGVSIKNAASWQISSSVIHGFMGAVQSAYGYAEDLNESLNNIRIVTGQTAAQMDKFAATASKAAKALSATTLDYTNASLIYYQQGLTDQQVKERTDVTIKMANVAQQSATVVSDQMTAIWNNFYDGSKSLEYYADVLVKLGAATASSTDEIAGGLEKFAAIGNTIGLSYEYAASALATITSNTRQSEEVVGTALKTIFARIQDLELGETLDDGTSLGSYAQALKAVGVDVLDTAGEMRKMDDILDDLAERWDGLSSATKTATAQAVAGTRQYVQLVALMDNWNTNDADSMAANLGYTRNASGELEEQAKIYSESWEAARDRVTASLEAIYNKLISDDAFITILDGVSAVIDGVGTLIDSLGGLKGVIFTIGSIVTRLFKDEMAQGLRNAASNISSFIGLNRKAQQDLKDETLYVLSQKRSTSTGEQTREAENASYTHESDMQKWLAKNGSHLTEEQMKQVQLQMDLVRTMDQRAIAAAKIADEAEREEEALITQISLQKKMEEREKQRVARAAIDQKIQTAKDEGEAGADYTKWKSDKQSSSLGKAFDLLKSQGLADDEDAKSWGKDREKGYSDVIAGLNALEGTQGLPDDVVSQVTQIKAEINAVWGAGVDDYVQHLSKEKVDITIDEEKIAKDIEGARTTIEKAATAVVYSQDLDKTARNVGSFSGTTNNKGIVDQDIKTYIQLAGKVKDTKRALSAIDNPSADVKKDIAQAKEWHQALTKVVALGKKIESTDFDPESEEGKKLLDDYAAAVDAVNQNLVEMQESLRTSKTDMSDLPGVTDAVETLGEDTSVATTVYNRVRAEREADNKNVDATEPASYFDTDTQGLQDWSTALVSAGEAVMSVGAIVSSVQGMIDVFNNPDASAWDKFSAVLSAIIPVISIINTLSALNTQLTEKSSTASLFAAVANAIRSTSELGVAASIKAVTEALITSPIMPYIVAIMAFVGALTLIAATISWITKAIHEASPEGQLEAAEAKAEELANALDDATSAADRLKGVFDSYNSAVDKLGECTKGTAEWRDALRQVNNEVMDILSEYPELATMVNEETGEKAITYGKNGELQIADWAQEEMLNQANQAVANIKTASILANQDVREKKAAVQQNNLTEAIDKDAGFYAASKTQWTGDGQAYQEDVSREVASYISAHAEEFSSKTPDDQKAMLEEYFASQGILADTGTWIKTIRKMGPSISELAATIDANTAAVQLENEALAANTLASEEAVQNSDYTDEITQMVAKDLDKKTDAEVQKLKDEGWGTDGIWQATGVNEKAREVFAKYADVAGIKNYDLIDTTGNDANRAFVYTNSEGKEVTVSLDMMRSVVAAANANEALAGNANQLVATLSDKSEQEVAAITAAVTDNARNLTVDQATGDYDINALANKLTEEDLKGMDYEGTLEEMRAAYIADYNKVAENANNQLTGIIDGYTDSVSSQMNAFKDSGDLNGLTLEDVDALGDALQQAFINSGTDGMNTLSEMYQQAAEAGFGDEFVDAIGDIDWSNITTDELEDYFKDAGISTNYTTDQLASLIEVMDDTSLSVEEACEKFASLVSILKDLNTGDTITAEEYNKNFRGKEGAEDLFLSMYDGNYKFIGDKSDLEHFKTDSYNEIMSAAATAVKDKQAYSNVSSWTAGDIQEVVNGGKTTTNTDLINLLKASGYGSSEEQLAKLAEFQNGHTQDLQTTVNDWINQIGGASAAQSAIADTMSDLEETIRTNGEKIASAASDIGELNSLLEQEKISEEDYNKAIQAITRDEYESYGLDPDDAEQISKAIEQDIIVANEEWYKSAQNAADSQERINEGLKDSTVRYARLNDAIEDIYDNYDNYTDVLKQVKTATDNASRAEAANSDNAKKLKKSLAGLLDTSEDFIDADLLAAIDPDDFEGAANGDINAIERIRNKFIELEGQMADLDADEIQQLQDALNELNDGAVITLDNVPFINTLVESWIKAGLTADEIESKLSGLGIDADVSAFDASMSHIAEAARAAGEYVVDATSFSSEAEAEPVETEVDNVGFEEHVTPQVERVWAAIPENNFFGMRIYQAQMPYFTKSVKQIPNPITVAAGAAGSVVTQNEAGAKGTGGIIIKNMHKSSGNKVSTSNATRKPVSSGSGGSASKPDIKEYTKKSDVVERYKEVNDQLDNVADSMSKVQNVADKLWGKDHIKNLQSQNALLSQQIALLEEEYEEALAYQKEDAEAVRAAAEAMGLSAVVSLDEGRITNIEDIQEQMYNQLHAAEEHYNSLATKDEQDSYKETVLEPLEKRIEAFEDAVGLFEDSSDTAMDAELKKQEARLEQMANNFTMWTENLDIPIELNEKDVEYIEWLISRLEDDVYEMAEKGALIIGSLSEGQIGGQMEKYLDNLELADASLKDLEASYAAGEITQADYIEGLDKISETYLGNIQNLDELDKTMQELYGETISAATEELARYTEQMEHSTSVLDHYKSVIELMGKSNDYEMIGKVLEGQAKTTKNQMEVSKQWYETMRTNADTAAAEYAAAQARGASEAELEILKQNWDEAETAANEAQEQMLSDAEAWAEKMKEVLENKLAGFGQTLENALTGGTSFDTMTGALERASSLQEEYLTTTNQIYETNKLMRQAQQEIDKTTNSVAKKRLAAYINETQQLQNQSKLSNYELEIQQAKYNLLLAEIALQEAQDAKSVVRLQRDSEGNLGYVYTADQDKIADAQQKLEDAQNSLYNIGLEGANGYVEKYSQLMSEMYDTITEIQSQYLEGAFESEEEYQNAIMEAKQYYYDKLKDYSSLYQIALTTDSRVVADAWSTDFADMTYNTAQWMDAIDIYVDQAAQAFKDWHNEVTGPDGLAGIGTDVDAVAASVESVVDKSDELAEITINTVIPALDDEMDSVQNLTGSYATLRDTIIEIIDKYGLMIDTINGKKRSYWEGGTDESGSGSGTGDANDSESTDTSSSDGTAGNAGNAAATKGLKVGDRVTVKGSVRQFSQKSGNQYMQEWVPGSEFEVFRIDGSQVLIGDRKRSGTYTGWVNRTDLEGFATGGYTGEWGSYGKLAMLHQKELVLNADDTKNFLASMELLDHILEVIDLQSASAQLGGLLTSPGVRDNNSTIEQNVHIEASFPNVQERSEIEEAFNNLINQASQYANRK